MLREGSLGLERGNALQSSLGLELTLAHLTSMGEDGERMQVCLEA